jgi:thiol-disulfide isomerase/thioredoxin
LISLFGTWCPNCNDEAVYLAELAKRYGERGLSILGVAFELTDDLERSVDMVGRYETLIQELLAE